MWCQYIARVRVKLLPPIPLSLRNPHGNVFFGVNPQVRCLLFEKSSLDLAHIYVQCFDAKGMRLGNPNSPLSSSFCK